MKESVRINLKVKLVNCSQLEDRFCGAQVKDLGMGEGINRVAF